MRKLLLGLGLMFCLCTVHAESQAIYPALVLDKMVKIKTAEKYGDELYWVITEFKSTGKNLQYTIPRYPVHWPAKSLDSIKNIQLWRGKVLPGQSSTIYIELVEHDAPPFDIDDSIGSVRLVIKNDHGKLKVEWQESENVNYDEAKEDNLRFEKLNFHGEGGEYLIKMHFKKLNGSEYRPIEHVPNSRVKLR